MGLNAVISVGVWIGDIDFWHIPTDNLVIETIELASSETFARHAITFFENPEGMEWSTETLDARSFSRFIVPDHASLVTRRDKERIFWGAISHNLNWDTVVKLAENVKTLFQGFRFNFLDRSWTVQFQVMISRNGRRTLEEGTSSRSSGRG